MIDIHSHILPGLDDGAPTLDVSLQMLRIAAAAGTTDIVATPHANTEYPFSPERVRQAAAEVASAWNGPLRIHYGCDFHLSAVNVQDALASPATYTIGGGPYLCAIAGASCHPPPETSLRLPLSPSRAYASARSHQRYAEAASSRRAPAAAPVPLPKTVCCPPGVRGGAAVGRRWFHS